MVNLYCYGLHAGSDLPANAFLGFFAMLTSAIITLVIPVYNEAPAIADNLKIILDHARHAPAVNYEVLVIDDGSDDDTARLVAELQKTESAIRLFSFTRNFGKEAAIHAGLEMARGDAVIVLDADLQHPPQLIPEMVRLWRAGMPLIQAIKNERHRSDLERWLAESFYLLLDWLSGLNLRGHCDYKLLDRKIVDEYLSWPERKRFFRGLIGWAAFPCASIPFTVPVGSRKNSRWRGLALIRYAIDNITSFSSLPLRIFALFGLIVLAGGFGVACIGVWQKLQGQALGGFTTVNLLIVFIGGTILLGLGMIGHYLARIYEEIKYRPLYVLREPGATKNCSGERKPEVCSRIG